MRLLRRPYDHRRYYPLSAAVGAALANFRGRDDQLSYSGYLLHSSTPARRGCSINLSDYEEDTRTAPDMLREQGAETLRLYILSQHIELLIAPIIFC
jgi:hypothetical protein